MNNHPRVTVEDIATNVVHIEYLKKITHSGKVLRWAILTTKCGHAVVGDPSVCVSPENDNEEIGERVALENSKREMWPLMGYELAQRIHNEGK